MRKQKRESNQLGNSACPYYDGITLRPHNDAPKWNARREEPPKRFLELVLAIEAMVRQPGALEVIRKHIHHAGAEFAKVGINVGPLPNLLGPGDPLSLDEKVVVLAGFHDAFHKAGRVHEIMPDEEFLGGQVGNFATPREETTFSLPIAMYKDVSAYFLDGCKVPDDSPEIDRLYDYLANVKADLAARGLPRPDDGKADLVQWAGGTKATLAVVFTDIVSSAALGNKLGDCAMNELRRAHFAHAAGQVSRFGGRVVKTIGDSVMAAFRAATDALDFAIAVNAEPGDLRIEVRAGLHVGPVTVEEADVNGGTVNYASRVIGQAVGAQVWLSSEAKSHVDQERSTKHASLQWVSHPGVEFKGFSGKHTLYSLAGR